LASSSPSKSTRVFVAYDFNIRGTLPGCRTAVAKSPPKGFDVEWPGAPDSKSQGEIWKDIVQPGIATCDRFLAFLDLPNANVGYEIGYAVGTGKRVALARVRADSPSWLNEPPMNGFLCPQSETPDDIRRIITSDHWIHVVGRPTPGEGVLLLCPSRTGGAYLEQIDDAWGWRKPPSDGWDLHGLPSRLEGIGLVLWIIVPHNEGDAGRDGKENAALSVVAGYAQAQRGIDVIVLSHASARQVADIVARRTPFADDESFEEKAKTAVVGWRREREMGQVAVSSPGAMTPRTPVPLRPRSLESLPHDTWPETKARFIGRQRQLIDAEEAVNGLRIRFDLRREAPGSQGVKLIWVHGFGGMGKSWFLHRVRCDAVETIPGLCALVVDFDPRPANAWRQPLRDLPKRAEDAFEAIAYRLAQRLGVGASDAYWLAKAQVAASAPEYRRLYDRFNHQVELAKGPDADRVEPDLRQLLRDECGTPGLWDLLPQERARRIARWGDDPAAVRRAFGAWCRHAGVDDPAVISPSIVLAEGLRESLRGAMELQPLLILLDTAELLGPDLHTWLREVLIPLLKEPQPLLLIVGSRLRPDADQRWGSRAGWLAELPTSLVRVDAFAELLRFSVEEIEDAESRLVVPLPGEAAAIATQLHRVTLGVPLAVRTLLDLHDQGDTVLADLAALDQGPAALAESDAVRGTIATIAERFLLHLADRPEKEEDYRAITALALLTGADHVILRSIWPGEPHERLLDLGSRYSLLADGDLHPTVRETLRRHWRERAGRPPFFAAVLAGLETAVADLRAPAPPARDAARFSCLAQALNLRAWQEGEHVLDALARGLALAAAYDVRPEAFKTLLAELPLPGDKHTQTRALWQRNEKEDDEKTVGWLRTQCNVSGTWTDEEQAALSLLEGITGLSFSNTPDTALLMLRRLIEAATFFGLPTMPQQDIVSAAFSRCGYSLSRDEHSRGALATHAATAYEHAIALGRNESTTQNNLGVIYAHLGKIQLAEECYKRAIELNPRNAFPYHGLGNLYADRGEHAEAEESYKRAVELDPKVAHPHQGLGNLYLELGKLVEAELSFIRAIELDPKIAPLHCGLGAVYGDLGRLAEAERCFVRAIELDPKLPYTHADLGALYEILGKPTEAERSYKRAIEVDTAGEFGGAQRGLAWVALVTRGDVSEAAHWASKAVATDPKHPGTDLVVMAVTVWDQGWARARDRFATWVRDLPPNDESLVWHSRHRLARLLLKGKYEDSLVDAAQILRSSATRLCWRPWAEALEAVVADRAIETITDARAREVYRLLQTSP